MCQTKRGGGGVIYSRLHWNRQDLGPVGGGSDTTGAPSVHGDVTNQLAAQERTLCTHVGKCLTNNHNRTACDENAPQINTEENVSRGTFGEALATSVNYKPA